MRSYDQSFWRTLRPLNPNGAIQVPSAEHALLVLAGEVIENHRIRLRDYLDYRALQQAVHSTKASNLCDCDWSLLRWLSDRMSGFSTKHDLPFCRLSRLNVEVRGCCTSGPALTSNGVRLGHTECIYMAARDAVRYSSSDSLGALLRMVYKLPRLWSQGCYIDSVRLNRNPGPLPPTHWEPTTPLLSTPIGDFLLVPFGVITVSDLRALKHAVFDRDRKK
jgi:hypothetical protein